MLESQLSGRTAVRSLAPSRVEMMPFWSTLRIMVASTKYISPFLSTAMPSEEEEERVGCREEARQTPQTFGVRSDAQFYFEMISLFSLPLEKRKLAP